MNSTLRIFALGGNEVSPSGATDSKTGKQIPADNAMQWQKTAQTCARIADIIQKHPNDLFVITHGNGPQVGDVLLRNEHSQSLIPPDSLDSCVASTQGTMGYMISQLNSELSVRGISRKCACVMTRVAVDSDDPDFKNPSKFIGSPYSYKEAMDNKAKNGWAVKLYKKASDGREIWRRVVPSPYPKEIVDIEAVSAMLDSGLIPITAGGGGIPVCRVGPDLIGSEEIYQAGYDVEFRRAKKDNMPPAEIYKGIEAVIDKDLATALLGAELVKKFRAQGKKTSAELFIFTGEDGAKINYQKPGERNIRQATLAEIKEIYNQKPPQFPPGSMGPKIKACINFVENSGGRAYITKTELFEETLTGKAGTVIIP